jgi:O-antigen/teichoic acid export membrane protein
MIIRLFGVGLTFIVNIILTRELGATGYGIYAFLFAIVNLAALPTQFGLPDLVVRETSRARASGAIEQLAPLWRWAHSFIVINTVVVISAIGIWLHLLTDSERETGPAFYIALILIPLIALANLRAAILRGLGHDILGQLPEHAIRPTLFVLGLFILSQISAESMNVAKVFAIQAIATSLAMVFGIALLWRFTPRSGSLNLTTTRDQRRGWFHSSLYMGAISGLILINNSVDIIMLGIWKNHADVGHYRLASTVGALITLGLQTMNLYAMPHLSRLFNAGEIGALSRVVVHSSQISFGFSILALSLILLFGEAALSFLFGAEFAPAFPILLVLAAGHLINAFFGPARAVMIMAGNERLAALLTIFGTLANIGMNILLIPICGPIGAAIASAVSISATKMITFVIVWRNYRVLSWPFPTHKANTQ